ncbi:MAG: sugar porter family MFS transporter [Bacteroidales bacterium]|jgi:sugar porter (SP) family MFS transporter|nr:sugar porter family MFS transporter [Bacteroidales bacterium]
MNKSYIVRVALIVALGGFLMGFDASVISGVVRFIEPYFVLTKIQLGWAVACLTLVATLTMLVAGPISDKIGRKKVLTLAAMFYAFSAVTSALATEFWFFIVARMIGGIGVGASLIIAPMYIAEISPPQLRGRLVSFNQLNIVLGISIAFFSNFIILKLSQSGASWIETLQVDKHPWRYMLGVEAIPAVFYFSLLFFVPKSPRWLALKGFENKALSIMKKASGETIAMSEFKAVKESIQNDAKKDKAHIKELFKPAMKLVLIIGIVIAITQQITGINAVFFYAPMIFEQSGVGVDASFSQAILVGVTNLIFTIVAIWLIDRVGRKPLLMVGISGIIVSMLVIGFAFKSADYTLDTPTVKKLSEDIRYEKIHLLENKTFESDLQLRKELRNVFGNNLSEEQERVLITHAIRINPMLVLLGIIGFVASFACSLGPVMWVLFSELFPNRLRGIAISFAGTINSAFSFLVQLVFPWELANLGNANTFFIYGAFGLIGLIILKIYLPETKGKSLEELEVILIKSKSK